MKKSLDQVHCRSLFLLSRRCVIFSMLVFGVSLASEVLGFRGELDNTIRGAASRMTVTRAQARSASARQVMAADLMKDARIVWDSETAVPFSIRGDSLGNANLGGKGLMIRGDGSFEKDAIAVMDRVSDLYRIRDAEQEFRVSKVVADDMAFHHVRLKQFYCGLRVVGGDLIVHFNKDNNAYEVNGTYVPGLDVGVLPGISGWEACDSAKRDLADQGYYNLVAQKGPDLVVFARMSLQRLAYEVYLTDGCFNAWRYWIDALDGSVLQGYSDLKTISAPASGEHVTISGSILAGEGGGATNVTGWRETNTNYYLWNSNQNWYIYNIASNGSYVDLDTYAYRGSNDWSTSDRTEMSAALNFSVVQDYFSCVHGRNSFNSNGSFAIVNVHFGNNLVNAYWYGGSVSKFFIGDGDGSEANSLAVLDVAAHEFGHAVTENTCDLTYAYESGALNESFSDIWGTCVEFHAQPNGASAYPLANPGQADWLMGEDCWLSATALRDMRDPANTATVGIGNELPSKYKGTHWYTGSGDNGGVHYNNGVQNFFFYLLSEGGSGTNDGVAYDVTGLGITNAERVAYRTLVIYCTPWTDYTAVREAWNSAALDLNSAWSTSVQAAWYAAGVGAAPTSSTPTPPTPGGPSKPLIYIESPSSGGSYVSSNSSVALAGTMYDTNGIASVRWENSLGGSGAAKIESSSEWVAAGISLYSGVNRITVTAYNSWTNNTDSIAITYTPPTIQRAAKALNDFDGDGKSDMAVYNPLSGDWYIYSAAGSIIAYGENWGLAGPVADYNETREDVTYLVAGDYNGNGCTDMGVFIKSTDEWYVKSIGDGTIVAWSLEWGSTGETAVPGDYDGDGKTDFAVFEPANGLWKIWTWRGDRFQIQFGWSETVPVPGDYDGDRITDFGVYHPASGTWYIWTWNGGYYVQQFGWASAEPVQADYDGDGKMDFAVYDPEQANWHILTWNNVYYSRQFGWSETEPVQGDYDGDGKVDLAVYYPEGGMWYIWTWLGAVTSVQWGWSDAVPVPAGW